MYLSSFKCKSCASKSQTDFPVTTTHCFGMCQGLILVVVLPQVINYKSGDYDVFHKR